MISKKKKSTDTVVKNIFDDLEQSSENSALAEPVFASASIVDEPMPAPAPAVEPIPVPPAAEHGPVHRLTLPLVLGVGIWPLLIISLALLYFGSQARLHAFEARYQKAVKETQALRALPEIRKETGRLEGFLKFSASVRAVPAKTSRTDLLVFLSRTLPENVWLEKFLVRDGKFAARGYAMGQDQAREFVEKLNGSEFFRRAEITSIQPVSEDGGRNTYLFEVSADADL